MPMPVTFTEAEVEELRAALNGRPPQEILRKAFEIYGHAAAISFSGAEDVVLLAMCHEEGIPLPAFTLDTGRLPPETYELMEKVREKYGIKLEVYSPNTAAVERLTTQKGLFSFYKDGHQECCGIRKVEPLQRALSTRRAWISGQRRDQSPDTRAELNVVELDRRFGSADRQLLKFNPLAHWSSAKVWSFIRAAEVPFNALHARGYVSIGCAPCTRAVLPGEHERAGRWSWEEATQRECGLHK
jgi:phosphoadenosine phosphosulfate reductase